MIKGHGDDAYHYAEGISSDFSSNICPHGSHQALMAHLASCGERLLAHYPEPEAWSLERLLAQYHDVAPGSVVVTNGATEAIYLVAQAFRLRPVIMGPTFSEYADACRQFPPTDSRHTVCWLCNPNNPTGQVLDQHDVERLSARHQLLVIDQSYEHYTDQFVWHPRWACRLPNVILLHSMTKTYGVPGLRLGYITAPVRLANIIRQAMRPWAVSALAIEAGKFLLEHDDELRCRPDLDEARRLWRQLNAIGGVSMQPTATNFMLGTVAHLTAAELKDRLARQHGMLIRDASNFRGLTPHHFRVAAQSPAENDALVEALRGLA